MLWVILFLCCSSLGAGVQESNDSFALSIAEKFRHQRIQIEAINFDIPIDATTPEQLEQWHKKIKEQLKNIEDQSEQVFKDVKRYLEKLKQDKNCVPKL